MGQPDFGTLDENLKEHLTDEELSKLKEQAEQELKQTEGSNDNEEG